MTFEEFDLFIKRSKKRWGKLYPYRPSVWIPRLKDVWYYFKCVLWKRHNVVKIRTLSPTWHDRDNMLLHASFQILVDFCEQEIHTPLNAGKTKIELIPNSGHCMIGGRKIGLHTKIVSMA